MGFGLPGAIGAYIADPTKDIILIAGDGGLQMNLQELQTISHYNIPIKMFILNNNGYLAISLMQDNLFNGNYIGSNKQSGVSAPDFIKIANAYGFTNYRFNTNEQLIEGIGEVLSKEGPVLVEITMPENQLLIPRVQSSKDENGNILSTSLEHMFPYLPAEEMKQIML
jgi:acetolactate synthase-1/2/3 large subunit